MPTRPHHPDPAFATTLAHGLALLQCFRVGETVLGNKELADRTGLSKATISRLTYTLAARGLLLYDTHLRRYRLGSTALSLGYPLLASLRVRQLARPLMKALADQVGGSVSLGLRDRLRMVYVETSRGHDAIAFRPTSAHRCRCWPRRWAGRGWHERRKTCATACSTPARGRAGRLPAAVGAVDTAIEELATLGFTRSRGDWQRDVHAVAVPMRTPIDGEILVFNCGVPAVRMTPRKLEREMGPRLLKLVAQVETLVAWE
jgi:DNA-binding IclR family transcriptional regulator